MKKKLLPKKSVNIQELRRLAGHSALIRPKHDKLNLTIALRCDECAFIAQPAAKIRFIRTNNQRVICEVCFEKLDISEWEFAPDTV